MKPVLTIIIFILCSIHLLTAQHTFTLAPNPVYADGPPNQYEIKTNTVIKNIGSVTDTFKWKRIVIRIEDDSLCETYVEDPYMHWLPQVSERNFVLAPNQQGPLNIALMGFYEPGCCAVVHMLVTKLGPAPDTIDGFYYLRECQASAAIEPQQSSIALFPNPAAGYFTLKNADAVQTVQLFDAAGRKVMRLSANSTHHYSIAALPSGAYYAVCQDADGRILQALRFSKL